MTTRPEASTLREADRTSGELRVLGVEDQALVINGNFEASDQSDPIAIAMEQRCNDALMAMPSGLTQLQRTVVPLAPHGLVGIDALRRLGSDKATSATIEVADEARVPIFEALPATALIDQLAAQQHGVIMTMGKGGVGKTTIAAAVAVALAQRGLKVHLSTTDPAAHVSAAMAADELSGLTIRRIDPAEVTEAYRQEVLRTAGDSLDEQGRGLLEEDLRSPCTEEIAVFRAFADAVAEGKDGFVVLDTAPTGHTILLLDSALAYHREVSRLTTEVPESIQKSLPRLRDPDFTRVLVVTLPESTPVHEAQRLQQDLRRAEIEPFAWVVNQSLSPLVVKDPILVGRQRSEVPYLQEVFCQHAKQAVIIPWRPQPPTGVEGLRDLIADKASC